MKNGSNKETGRTFKKKENWFSSAIIAMSQTGKFYCNKIF